MEPALETLVKALGFIQHRYEVNNNNNNNKQVHLLMHSVLT